MSTAFPLRAIPALLLLPALLCSCNRGSELRFSTPTAPLVSSSPTTEECQPRPQTYWRRQCDTHLEIAPAHPDWPAEAIGELLAVTDAILAPLGEESCDALRADPPDDPCQWALQQYAAALLNHESGFLGEDALLWSEDAGALRPEHEIARLRFLIDSDRCAEAAERGVRINAGEACLPAPPEGGGG